MKAGDPQAPGEMVRALRWLLIRNGFSETEADAALARVRAEFASSEIKDTEQFEKLCETITQALVEQAKPKGSRENLRKHLAPWVLAIGGSIIANALTSTATNMLAGDQMPSLIPPISPASVHRVGGTIGIVFRAKRPHAAIEATSSGLIVQSEAVETGVYLIRIAHSNKWETRYLFLGHGTVRKGDFVRQGQKIGQLTGTSLVFLLWHGGAAIDDPQYQEAETLSQPSIEEARLILRAIIVWQPEAPAPG